MKKKTNKEDLVFLDVETTGIEEKDRLCQIAYCMNGKCVSENFKPPLPISIDAMSVCHITNEMVADCPPFDGSILQKELQGHLNNGGILIAHNAQFDLRFLEKEGVVPKRHICTLKLAHAMDKEAEWEKYNLQFLRYKFGLALNGEIRPHEALSDVYVLEVLFNEVFAKFFTIEEMLKISSEPILFKKWMFGKHKRKTFQETARTDLDYLLWFRRSAENLDENMLHTLNYWINHRT